MITPTERQQDALRFIAGYREANGVAPTLREIGEGLGLAGNTAFTADWLVRQLEDRGAVERTGMKRAIAVTVPVAIPRAPDGAPLHFVRIGGAA